MAPFNAKIHSLCLQCLDSMSSLMISRPLSTSLKRVRYQVCPPKKETYQVVSKITPQLLEQIQKKALGAGGLQPGRLPQIFNTHPLNLPLVSSIQTECCLFNNKTCKTSKTDSKLYFSTSAVHLKKQKKGKKGKKKGCKKGKKGKKNKKDKKKGQKKCKLMSEHTKCSNIKMNNCAPTSSKVCTRDSAWPPCNKKCAPYPAYSEACHENKPLPPSECRICPWTKEGHPTFKEKPKSYHTSCHNVSIMETPLGIAMRLNFPGSLQNLVPMPSNFPTFVPTLIDPCLPPSAEILCNKCGKDGDGQDSCGQRVKSCKKKDKKKKKQGKKGKRDKCKKSKKGKKKSKKGKKKPKKDKKKKLKKRKCNPQWKHPPCEKPDGKHSQICPKDLIKKPKCP